MITKLADTYYTYKFLRLLTQPWGETEAFKLGIVSNKGEKLKDIQSLTSEDEKIAYSRFVQLVFKIRKLLEKVPVVKSSIGKYATAFALLKEETGGDLLEEVFLEHLGFELTPHVQSYITNNKYTCVFNLLFEEKDNELVLVTEEDTGGTGTGGVDMSSPPLFGPKKEKVEGEETFSGAEVFHCDTETLLKCRLGKTPFLRYSKFVGNCPTGQKIREYCLSNPTKPVILKDITHGLMIYLRRKK